MKASRAELSALIKVYFTQQSIYFLLYYISFELWTVLFKVGIPDPWRFEWIFPHQNTDTSALSKKTSAKFPQSLLVIISLLQYLFILWKYEYHAEKKCKYYSLVHKTYSEIDMCWVSNSRLPNAIDFFCAGTAGC